MKAIEERNRFDGRPFSIRLSLQERKLLELRAARAKCSPTDIIRASIRKPIDNPNIVKLLPLFQSYQQFLAAKSALGRFSNQLPPELSAQLDAEYLQTLQALLDSIERLHASISINA